MSHSIDQKSMESKPVKIHLISGFRGAGKTTLLEYLAKNLYREEKTVFLQNEFGKKGLFLPEEANNISTAELRGGCICCTQAGLLTQALFDSIKAVHPSRIVMELAETARIADVKELLLQPEGAQWELERVMYVCNAKSFFSKMRLSRRFWEGQIAESPLIFLNRAETVSKTELESILQAIEAIHPGVTVVTRPWEQILDEEWENYYAKSQVIKGLADVGRHNIMAAFSDFHL